MSAVLPFITVVIVLIFAMSEAYDHNGLPTGRGQANLYRYLLATRHPLKLLAQQMQYSSGGRKRQMPTSVNAAVIGLNNHYDTLSTPNGSIWIVKERSTRGKKWIQGDDCDKRESKMTNYEATDAKNSNLERLVFSTIMRFTKRYQLGRPANKISITQEHRGKSSPKIVRFRKSPKKTELANNAHSGTKRSVTMTALLPKFPSAIRLGKGSFKRIGSTEMNRGPSKTPLAVMKPVYYPTALTWMLDEPQQTGGLAQQNADKFKFRQSNGVVPSVSEAWLFGKRNIDSQRGSANSLQIIKLQKLLKAIRHIKKKQREAKTMESHELPKSLSGQDSIAYRCFFNVISCF